MPDVRRDDVGESICCDECHNRDAALQSAKTQLPADGSHQLIIKSVSAKQRPRRIAATKKDRNSKKKRAR